MSTAKAKRGKSVVTSTSPTSLRLTQHYKNEGAKWCDELSELAGRDVSLAKMLMGLIEMRAIIKNERLLKAIRDSTY